jgi:hypothetical protein
MARRKDDKITIAQLAEYSLVKKIDRKTLLQLHDELNKGVLEATALASDKPVDIKLFELGFVGDLKKDQILKLLNRFPGQFSVSSADKISSIGDPDIYELAYSDQRLIKLFPKSDQKTIRYGIILSPIEGNYYSRTISYDTQVLSLYQVEEICKIADRSIEEYIVQTILTDILSLKYFAFSGHYIFHRETRGCIFDFSRNKQDKVHKLQKLTIDPTCRKVLSKSNIPEQFVEAIKNSLQRIKKPTFFDTFRKSLRNPVFSFFYGGLCIGVLINIVSSLALGELDSLSDYLLLGTFLFLIIVIPVVNFWRASSENHLEVSSS